MAPTIFPSTVTLAWLTRCTTARITRQGTGATGRGHKADFLYDDHP
jgi:hypothetical protein